VRPGEKINEVLLTEEESKHTKEFEEYFSIEPEFKFWDKSNDRGGKHLPEGFKYSSDENKKWLEAEDIKNLLKYRHNRGMKIIPYGHQWIDNNDIKEVVKVLKSDRLTQGPKIEEFEKAIAKYCNVKYAVAVSSGTSALYLAYVAAGIKSGMK